MDKRGWIHQLRDWLMDRVPVTLYEVQTAIFYTDRVPVAGTIFLLDNGTRWVVKYPRSFGFYADCIGPLQKGDIQTSHNYKGIAVEVAEMYRESSQHEILNHQNPNV